MTTEPRTKAGRALNERLGWFASEKGDTLREGILAIEAEAARLALKDTAERVRGLPTFDDGAISRSTDVVLPCVDRAAVLTLLSTEESRTDDDERHERLVASGRMTCEDMRHDHD